MSLTTLAKVQSRLKGSDATYNSAFDTLLGEIVLQVDGDCRALMGHRLIEEPSNPLKEYLDGSGHEYLFLAQGPIDETNLGALTVEEVSYGSGGETLTTVTATDYAVDGVVDTANGDRHATERVEIRLLAGVWAVGRRNFLVTYTPGWPTVPPALEGIATAECVRRFMNRTAEGRSSEGFGSASARGYVDPEKAEAALRARLRPWTFPPVG